VLCPKDDQVSFFLSNQAFWHGFGPQISGLLEGPPVESVTIFLDLHRGAQPIKHVLASRRLGSADL
jgi:hypothetical protein